MLPPTVCISEVHWLSCRLRPPHYTSQKMRVSYKQVRSKIKRKGGEKDRLGKGTPSDPVSVIAAFQARAIRAQSQKLYSGTLLRTVVTEG